MGMDRVNSELIALEDVVERGLRFNIPRYQRLYVWEDEQVKTLFNDILTAAISGKDLYFLGAIILVERERGTNAFDLVDGQQRFTTLWLLTNELGGRLQSFTKVGDDLRLQFSIRPMVKEYFTSLSQKEASSKDAEDKDFADLERISKARTQLRSLIDTALREPAVRESFENFLWNRLKMVATTVPPSTDLNKLFEALNNRGEQLAQHEIHKARMLAKLKSGKDRHAYGKLWSACSDMENYFERALAKEVGSASRVADVHDREWFLGVKDVLNIFGQGDSTDSKPLKLSKIVKMNWDETTSNVTANLEEHPDTEDDEKQPVRSILTFPQLLLHTLRIYLFRRNGGDIQRINEKELLEVFKNHLLEAMGADGEPLDFSEQECREFLKLLFEIREVFDRYIIKWVRIDENEEVHLIKDIKKQNQKKGGWTYYLRRQRTDRHDGFALLQSMLYHSQQNTTQYWLTPLLNKLWHFDSPDFDAAYTYLKKLDNVLFSTGRDGVLLTERTKECMDSLPEHAPTTAPYDGDHGTGFPHYLFYKLEFALWHERDSLAKPKWSSYRMTAKNSVEHVSPQHPQDDIDSEKACKTETNRIGNLVLVTRSINSEYGNQPYKMKRVRFTEKLERGHYDSLKSDLIYQNEGWGDEQAREHSSDMKKVLEGYFEKTMR